jgi:ferredoxin
VNAKAIIERQGFQQLLNALCARGYQIIGPTVRDGAIVYDELTTVSDLPIGWTDEQAGGKYRLVRRNDDALFGYNVGPQAWKRFLYPPILRLWRAERTGHGFALMPEEREPPRYAFLGVRACELHAIQIQDQVFLHGNYSDPDYQARRAQAFIVAVNCGQAGGTCFCASMQTGPKVATGFDLALTEVLEDEQHYFVVDVGTEAGAEVLGAVPHRAANAEEIQTAERIVAETATHMGRALETAGLKALFYRNLEHPRWDEVASRCLTCANCTLVCPTCFCTTVEDVTDLSGQHAERWRKADSCFTTEFSRIYTGSVRASAKARYRQWLTHKLATWVDQFGTFGCVGCGRCITWCPVGIDITEEVRAIRMTDSERR